MESNQNTVKMPPMGQKKKTVQVRQTLSSKLRLLQNNYLLRLELEKKLASQTVKPVNDAYLMKTPLRTLAALLEKPEFENNQTEDEKKTDFDKFKGKNTNIAIAHPMLQQSVATAKNPMKTERNFSLNKDQKNWSLNPHRVSKEMTRRLREWMKSRGRNLKEYRHLQCFGIHLENKNLDKKNIHPPVEENNNLISQAKEKGVPNEDIDFPSIALSALLILHKMILEGYPLGDCEIWLRVISEKVNTLVDGPQYWECRAALEQSKGDMSAAEECYKFAIKNGAQVQTKVHFTELSEKLKLMNISTDIGHKNQSKDQDAKNIFNSRNIQFAVQERIIRTRNNDGVSLEKKIIATPVRRSTRQSRSAYTITPKVQIYSTLQEVNSPIRKALEFKSNNALRD